MMSAGQCQERAAAALEAADAAPDPELRVAWEAVAQEWEVIAAIADLQRTLMRPGRPQEPH